MDEPLWVSWKSVGGTGFFESLVPQQPDPTGGCLDLASPYGRGITRHLVEVFLCVLKIHLCNLQCVLTRLSILFVYVPMLAAQSVIEKLDLIFPVDSARR